MNDNSSNLLLLSRIAKEISLSSVDLPSKLLTLGSSVCLQWLFTSIYLHSIAFSLFTLVSSSRSNIDSSLYLRVYFFQDFSYNCFKISSFLLNFEMVFWETEFLCFLSFNNGGCFFIVFRKYLRNGSTQP